MYIINDLYFKSQSREIPNLDEADSKAFAELENLIDEKGRLFMRYFLTDAEILELESFLVNGLFPIVTTGIPQKWIDLVNGKDDWKGLIYTLGSSKHSIIADFVYYHYLVNQVSYMTGVGDAKANPKGANLVNPTQRIVTVWNEFVKQYQGLDYPASWGFTLYYNKWSSVYSLLGFINSKPLDYTRSDICCYFEIKNQLGL